MPLTPPPPPGSPPASPHAVRRFASRPARAPLGPLGTPGGDLPRRLREDTGSLHAQVERRLGLPGSVASLAHYLDLLRLLHELHAALETRLAALPGWAAAGLDLDARRKTPWLRSDLAVIRTLVGEASAPAGPATAIPPLPPIETLADGLGCLYVLEGATLGGQIIAPALEAHLGLDPGQGTAFFRAYRERTGPMWTGFRTCLVAYPAAAAMTATTAAETADRVVASAAATFVAYDAWVAARWSGAVSDGPVGVPAAARAGAGR